MEGYSTSIPPQNKIVSIYLHPAKDFGNILYSIAFSAPHCHELFIYANLHVAEAAYTAFELPMETFMLAMILEIHKEVIRLMNELDSKVKGV